MRQKLPGVSCCCIYPPLLLLITKTWGSVTTAAYNETSDVVTNTQHTTHTAYTDIVATLYTYTIIEQQSTILVSF